MSNKTFSSWERPDRFAIIFGPRVESSPRLEQKACMRLSTERGIGSDQGEDGAAGPGPCASALRRDRRAADPLPPKLAEWIHKR